MKKIVCIIAVLSLVLFAGCGSKKSVDEANGKKLMTKFCRVFFETNYENRYTDFVKDKDQEKYYKAFEEMATKECLKDMMAGRNPLKYDKKCAEDGIAYEPADIELTKSNDEDDVSGSYEFKMILKEKNSGERINVVGQISIEEKDGKLLVSKIYISSMSKE